MSSTQTSAPALPLFYRQPEPMRADRHGRLRLVMKPDFRFAARTNAVPIMVSEFALASRFYPIVFAGQHCMPVAVLGIDGTNLFVDSDGLWQDRRTYIPAYVRRYPFTFITQPGQQAYALGLDMACERLVSEASDDRIAQPLFADGKPTMLTEEALRFCGALQTDHATTRAFTAALEAADLLTDRQARAALPDGRRFDLQGFRIVDGERYQKLADATLVDWHRKSWLALVHAHLASQACWQELLERVRTKDTTPQD